MAGIYIDQETNLNKMQFYNSVTRSVYTTGYYKLDMGRHMNTKFGLNYDVDIIYSSYYNPTPEPYPPANQVRCLPTNSELVKGTVQSIPHPYTSSLALEEDPTYLIQLQDGNLVCLTLKQLDSLAILPPLST